MKEKKALVEDALHATRAAVEEGIVPGGGVALLRAQAALSKLKLEREDEQIGVQILSRALEHPIRQIAENAGAEGSIVAVGGVGENNVGRKDQPRLLGGFLNPMKAWGRCGQGGRTAR